MEVATASIKEEPQEEPGIRYLCGRDIWAKKGKTARHRYLGSLRSGPFLEPNVEIRTCFIGVADGKGT